MSSKFSSTLLLLISILMSIQLLASAGNFYRDVDITWGEGRGKIQEGGRGLALSLDKLSGSGFQSKNEYLFGRFDMQLKLVPKNSAGTVTTFFVSLKASYYNLNFIILIITCHPIAHDGLFPLLVIFTRRRT